MKNLGEKGVWAYPGTAQCTPMISGTGEATNFKFGRCIHSVHANKNLLKFGRKIAWAHQGTAELFSVPPIVSGTCKAMNFKFGTRIHRVHANKSALKIGEKRERGRIRGLPKFFQ